MRIESLQYFIVAAECKSITLCSKILHLSQQCVSREIKQMENELGVQLFSRSKQGVILTPEGQEAYQAAVQIYEQFQHFNQMFSSCHNTICLTLSACRSYIKPLEIIVKIFQKAHSKIAINDYYCSTEQIELSMKDGVIDFALQHLEKTTLQQQSSLPSLYTHIPLLEEPLQVVYNKNPVLDNATLFKMKDLENFPLFFYCESALETSLFQQIAQRYATHLNIVYKGNQAQNIQNHCQKDNAITLMTKSLASMCYQGTTHLIPCDVPISICTVLSIKNELLEKSFVTDFVTITKDFFQQYAYSEK